MKFTKKNAILALLGAVFTNSLLVHSTSTNKTKNATEGEVQFSGWKPMVKPEALTAEEFVEKLETVAKVAKLQNVSDMEAADTKRSFILVYPPRPSATEEKPQKQNLESPPNPARNQQGPPLRSYPTQSRYHRMMNFGVPESANGQNRRAPAVYQRPKFPPVANPPPIPQHALRSRQRIPPNFTPESTSRHQVQIQLLDGYIVPPSGGGATNNHAEKKTPQITTFPLNLNNVPEIRLLLPGDVHEQLNSLRQPHQKPQNHNSGPQISDGRNIYSFESQRRPGRTVEYGHTNNGRPQQPNFNQNQRTPDKDYSPRDPAVYPETVNFPGQNNQNSINNAVPYNHVKPQAGDVSSNDIPSNQGQFPDNRSPGSHTKTHDGAGGQNYPQNYAGDETLLTDNRGPAPHSSQGLNGQGYPQSYGGQQNPATDNRGSVSHSKPNGQGYPQNYDGQQNPAVDNRGSVPHSKTNGQGYPQNYDGQQNPAVDNRGSVPHSKTNGQGYPQNYDGQQNPALDNRGSVPHSRTNGQVFPQNHRGQVGDNRTPLTQVKIDDVPNYSNLGGQQGPSLQNGNSVAHSSTHDTANSPHSNSPNFNGHQNHQPSFDSGAPGHSRPQGSTAQSIPQNFVQQKYEPDDIQTGQIPIDPFQGNSFRPLSTDSRNYNSQNGNSFPGPQTYSRGASGIKTNNNGDDRRAFQSGGWRATPGNQNYNPAGVSPNFYSGPAGNQPTKTHNGQRNGQPGTSFSYFGTGTDPRDSRRTSDSPSASDRGTPNHQKTHAGSHSPSSTSDRDHRTRPTHHTAQDSVARRPSVSGAPDTRSRSHNHKTHVPSSGSGSPHHQTSRGSGGAARRPSSSDQDGRSRFHSGQKTRLANHISATGSGRDAPSTTSHGSGSHSPSGSGHDSHSVPGVDKSVPTDTLRGRRTEDALGNQPDLGSKSSVPTDDIYFVPPVLSQQEQIEVDPFDSPASRDTTVDKGHDTLTETGRGDGGLIDPGDIPDFATVDGVPKTIHEMTFARQQSCDCSQSCAPIPRSPDEDLGTSIREVARSLNADAFFDFVGLTNEEIENTLASDGSYTFFIPSNEAVSRLPSNLVDHWRDNNPDLKQALLNHVVRDRITLDQLKLGGRMTSRANDATIFINNYNNEAVTVNGHRIVYGDVSAPKGGTIHVIDGTLCPVADQDIINTLRTCNKYDGFLTLADVTKLLETMQDEGPYTVFLPSNEALTKIPADELAVLKENSTVLREFLEYHIVQGAYFSGDLKDGQYLTTLHQRQPVRMGVRADGCFRRLVEANNSPLFKSDIPTKNGVIHVVDWILRPSDLQWCDGVILP